MLRNISRNVIIIFCLYFFTVLQAAAQEYQGLLWQISGNGLEKPSYLFGTIHLTDDRVFELPDSLLPALVSCSTFAGELNLSPEELEKNQQEILKNMLMPSGTTLKSLLPKVKYKIVRKEVRKEMGVKGLLVMNRIKPIYLSFMLSEFNKEKAGKDKPFLDIHLQNVAKDSGLTVTGLETVQEQMSALEAVSLEKQADMLVEQVKAGKDSSEKVGEQMVQAYLSGNLDSLYSFLGNDDMPEELRDALIFKRNIVMTRRMEELMREEPSFFAVGAGHIPASGGIIELLREKGYTVRPVN